MVTTVTLTGPAAIGDVQPGWTVQEDATPVAIGDTSGSFGAATIAVGSTSTSDYAADKSLALRHDNAGTWNGRVSTGGGAGLTADLRVAGPLEFLNVTRTALPVGRTTSIPGVFLGTLTIAGSFIAVDSSGNIFTGSSNTVRKYNSAGSLVTSWGTFGTGNGQFNQIVGVAVDSTGAVYVVDQGNNRIQKFTNAGTYTLQWGSAGSGDGLFSLVQGIGISPTNEIYTVEFGNRRVQKFNTSGTFQTKWGTVGSGNGQFQNPNGVATDAAGNVYVSDSGNDRVQKFTNTGTFTLLWGGTDGYGEYQFKNLQSIAVSASGIVMVVDSIGQQVKAYTTAGVFVTRWGSAAGGFTFPIGIAIGPTGTINVLADSGANVLYQYGYSTFGGEYLSSVFDTYIRLVDPNRARDQFRWTASIDPIVNFPGWRDKVWVKLKELCAAFHVQMDVINGVVTISDIGSRTLVLADNTPVRLSSTIAGGGSVLNITHQNQTAGASLTMYSAAADSNKVYTVDVNQISTVTLQTDSHPLTLQTPTVTDTRPAPAGTYGVQDSTGAAVPAATWTYFAGRVDANIGTLPGQIVITVVGPNGLIPDFTGPFSLVSGTGSDKLAQLSVLGAGVVTDPRTIPLLTPMDPNASTQDVAKSINNVFLGSQAAAFGRASWAVDQVVGPIVTLTFEISIVKVQGFGLTTGCLVPYRQSIYRVTSVTFRNLSALVTVVRHVTGADVAAALPPGSWTGAQVVALWAGYTAADVKVRPLRTA